MSACEAEMHDEYNGDGCAILTEMIQSDICVEGTTDKENLQMKKIRVGFWDRLIFIGLIGIIN